MDPRVNVLNMGTISNLRITTIADNLVMSLGLRGQWGFSALLEFTDASGNLRRILLDTGYDRDAFLHNVKELKLRLAVDALVLSHGHLDHTAATVDVVKASGGTKVFAHPGAFEEKIRIDPEGNRSPMGVPKGQGLNEIEAAGGVMTLTRDPIEIVPGLWTTGEVPRGTFETIAPKTQTRWVTGEDDHDDSLRDDLSLYADVADFGCFVISGCAHSGPINILNHIKQKGRFNIIRGYVGGTHLAGRDQEYIDSTINGLQSFGLNLLAPSHCTGFKAAAELWKAYPDTFALNFCGRTLETGKEPTPRVL
ncbi:MAG: MBL fold metallo-hydrolase [Candidatus Bathyarchaeota archaeon]|nr:MBL fold metallo-hydrolase [Candidatus Bathyarchaeota archaeon]